MAFLIALPLFALLILLLGFLGIKIPFVFKRHSKLKMRPNSKPDVTIREQLVKDSVYNTIRTTKFLTSQHERSKTINQEMECETH